MTLYASIVTHVIYGIVFIAIGMGIGSRRAVRTFNKRTVTYPGIPDDIDFRNPVIMGMRSSEGSEIE